MRRWLVALAALLCGGGASLAVLAYGGREGHEVEVYVAARDLPAGALIGPEGLRSERLRPGGSLPLAYTRGVEKLMAGRRAARALRAGQLLQRGDLLTAASALPDRRLVLVPIKDLPPVVAGDRVDLLQVSGAGEHLVVAPFALGVEVAAAGAGGLVLVVSSRQAPAFVYAAATLRLAAVVAQPDAAAGEEGPVSSPEQALAAARR